MKSQFFDKSNENRYWDNTDRLDISKYGRSSAKFLALMTIVVAYPAQAQSEQTPEEKIEALERKVVELEQLVKSLLTDQGAVEAVPTTENTAEKSLPPTAPAPSISNSQVRPRTPSYAAKVVGKGTPPSQNYTTSDTFGSVSCAMRVFANAEGITDPAVRLYFETEAIEEEGKFRPISPDLSYAVRENPGRIAACDLDQIERTDGQDRPNVSRKGSLAEQAERTNDALRQSAVNSLIPGRPLQLGGVRPTFELGSSSTATLNISAPIYGRTDSSRICKDIRTDKEGEDTGVRCAPGFRSTIFAPFFEFSTPLSDGAGLIFTGEEDDNEETEGLEFADKISIKAGFDWLNFRGVHYYETERAMAAFLDKARTTCLRSVRAERDPTKDATNRSDEIVCERNNVVDWVLAFKVNTDTRSGFSRARAELAQEFENLQWRAPKNSVPTLGLGASIKYTTQDFTFRQASVSDMLVDGDLTVVPDFSEPLSPSFTRPTDNFEIEGHGLIYLDLMGDAYRSFTPARKIPGVLFVPQFTYTSTYAFADSTKFTNCDFDPSIRPANCSEIQIDAPRRRDISSISLEARARMLNVPVLNQLGFAPKVSYRLDDDGLILDAPVFFSSKGEFTSGIRARYTTGINDLLGNPVDDKWEVSFFFTPLTFTGFK